MPSFGPSGAIYGEQVILAASAARTVTGNGSASPTGQYSTLRLLLDVTAVAGTSPSMTVTVETSSDGTTWWSAGTFAAKTTAVPERKAFGGIDRLARVAWAITGTSPSFTFSVSGEAL